MIPIAKPLVGEEEKQAVMRVLESGNLAQGEVVERFEQEFARYIGVKYAVATSSGTTALHLALLALGIGNSDEVITTPFSFIASSNAILYVGARPVFVDIDEKTFNINPSLIEARVTARTKAILPVHLFGLPADMEQILEVAKKHNLAIIEDACQAHGAEISAKGGFASGENGKKVGSFGDLGCFSFYPTKNMTAGEGGMITTNNDALADKIRLLRNHGMRARYKYEMLGYNFRMTNIGAAIGLEQLKKLDGFNQKRVENTSYLTEGLKSVKGIICPAVPAGYKHVFHQYTIRVTKEYNKTRDELSSFLKDKGVGSAIFYPTPIHKEKIYSFSNESLPVAERMAGEVLSLPVHPGLSNQELEFIVSAFS